MWHVDCGLWYVDAEGEYSICGLPCQVLTRYVDYAILLKLTSTRTVLVFTYYVKF